MDAQKVDNYILSNGKFFESSQQVKEKLLALDESKWDAVQSVKLKDPTMILIISILIGSLGIDRFMLGDTGMGVGKLLTCGGLGIWTIIDWFMVMGAAKAKNLAAIQQL